MKINILEEFTRFGGGQTVFGYIFNALTENGYNPEVVTDGHHRYLPDYVSKDSILETSLNEPDWSKPISVFPALVKLKKELRKTLPEGASINNHPNVFLYNATINFAHEIFGFMAHTPSLLDRPALIFLKKTGIFSIYKGANFLVQGKFTKRQTIETMKSLGVFDLKIDTIDLPVVMPDSVRLESKEKSVLTFGRISPDKMLENALQIARSIPDVKFTLAGKVFPKDKKYVDMLSKEAPENVSIVVNPDTELKDLLFRKNKVYFHTKKNENYGISVAEAVSYGCYPIVPVEGGAFEDVLQVGKIGAGYASEEEAIQLVLQGLEANRNDLESIYSSRERFSPERFKDHFITKLNELL